MTNNSSSFPLVSRRDEKNEEGNKFSFSVCVKQYETKADGRGELYAQCLISRKQKKFALRVSVEPKFFDRHLGIIKSRHPESVDLNLIIQFLPFKEK